jgi:hypothetical protein
VPAFSHLCLAVITHTAEQIDLIPQRIDTLEMIRAAEALHSAS